MDTPKQNSQQTSKIKFALKELLPAYVIAFTFCFMLAAFEPLLMYSTNQLDFWFDMPLLIGPVLGGFALSFLACAAALTAVYAVNKALVKGKDKEPLVYQMTAIAFFLVFLAAYMQGNLLAGSLPALDGSMIDWNEFANNDILTLAIWIALGMIAIIVLFKAGPKRTLKYSMFGAGALFIMLFVSMVTELISWNALARKDSIITTNKNFDKISTDRNFIIFLNDAVGSVEFGNVLEYDPEYKKVFEDFTYYPDTLSCYPCTRDNIPVVLGGAVNKNEMEFEDFSSQALNASPLFNELTERGYDINLYESELVWYGTKNFNISNSADYKNYSLPFSTFWREELKYLKYKYLPYYYKRYSGIETMDFNSLVDKFIYDDRTIYKTILNTPQLSKTSGKSFRFIHTEGAHIPFKYDKYLNILDDYVDYETKIEATITMTKAYLDRLKANGTYDNSVIIIMADHGNTDLNSADDMFVRANPMFMIKGINEHHEFTTSDKPLSFTDLMGLYTDLLDGKTAEEATADIPDERERYFMWYRNFRLEHHIVEYVVTDDASEWWKFRKTGNEYDLK